MKKFLDGFSAVSEKEMLNVNGGKAVLLDHLIYDGEKEESEVYIDVPKNTEISIQSDSTGISLPVYDEKMLDLISKMY